jgi:hypothetical protein
MDSKPVESSYTSEDAESTNCALGKSHGCRKSETSQILFQPFGSVHLSRVLQLEESLPLRVGRSQ